MRACYLLGDRYQRLSVCSVLNGVLLGMWVWSGGMGICGGL